MKHTPTPTIFYQCDCGLNEDNPLGYTKCSVCFKPINGFIHAEFVSHFTKLKSSHDELLEAAKEFINREPKDGDKGRACTWCDMGGAGYSTNGDGHHDDIRNICPVLKLEKAIQKAEGK